MKLGDTKLSTQVVPLRVGYVGRVIRLTRVEQHGPLHSPYEQTTVRERRPFRSKAAAQRWANATLRDITDGAGS